MGDLAQIGTAVDGLLLHHRAANDKTLRGYHQAHHIDQFEMRGIGVGPLALLQFFSEMRGMGVGPLALLQFFSAWR